MGISKMTFDLSLIIKLPFWGFPFSDKENIPSRMRETMCDNGVASRFVLIGWYLVIPRSKWIQV